jgi:hypothetical protein
VPRPLSQIDELGDSVRQVIRAYHGSPYDFDRFDASKIGTGEGNQAYGHGMYFAGAEDVADTYRRSVSALQRTPKEDALEFWRRHVERTDNPRNAVQYAIDDAEESMQEAAGIPQAEQRWREIIQHLYEVDYRQPIPRRPGHMYEVELGVPEKAMLDWDAPISRQPKVVQKVFGAFAMDRPGDGGRIYRDIATRHGEAFDDDMTGVLANLAASRELLAEGVPGVRYLDGNFRAAGQGTRNFVMFPGTEDSIRILRKYGMMAPIAAGATADE